MADRVASSITPTPLTAIASIVAQARHTFEAGVTAPLPWRVGILTALRQSLIDNEATLLAALASDLGKPSLEAWATEIGFTINDIDHTLAHLAEWAADQHVGTPLTFKPGSSKIVRQPKGVVCVIAPWNYPLQLLLVPMVAAVAAGNAVVAKPSEVAPATSGALANLIDALNDPAIAIVQGAVPETTELLHQRFDHILYTGNSTVARIVMRAAAEHLTPVTLELGGKSPAIVCRDADITVAARRIAWGKFVNSGQTCIAPDYVLVDRGVHDEFIDALRSAINTFYGARPAESADYARIINDHHFARVAALIESTEPSHIAIGGQSDPTSRFIAPTVLVDIDDDHPAMAGEIFGPVLPVLAVDSVDEAIAAVQRRSAGGHRPLALYSFSESDDDNDRVLRATLSGGVCINGTLLHMSNPNLPFGGVGESGSGSYHGKFGFDTFSHLRAVHQRSTKLDPSLMYPPYSARKERLIRKGLRMSDPRDLLRKLRGRRRLRRE